MTTTSFTGRRPTYYYAVENCAATRRDDVLLLSVFAFVAAAAVSHHDVFTVCVTRTVRMSPDRPGVGPLFTAQTSRRWRVIPRIYTYGESSRCVSIGGGRRGTCPRSPRLGKIQRVHRTRRRDAVAGSCRFFVEHTYYTSIIYESVFVIIVGNNNDV